MFKSVQTAFRKEKQGVSGERSEVFRSVQKCSEVFKRLSRRKTRRGEEQSRRREGKQGGGGCKPTQSRRRGGLGGEDVRENRPEISQYVC